VNFLYKHIFFAKNINPEQDNCINFNITLTVCFLIKTPDDNVASSAKIYSFGGKLLSEVDVDSPIRGLAPMPAFSRDETMILVLSWQRNIPKNESKINCVHQSYRLLLFDIKNQTNTQYFIFRKVITSLEASKPQAASALWCDKDIIINVQCPLAIILFSLADGYNKGVRLAGPYYTDEQYYYSFIPGCDYLHGGILIVVGHKNTRWLQRLTFNLTSMNNSRVEEIVLTRSA
jgi:hypothetical protein